MDTETNLIQIGDRVTLEDGTLGTIVNIEPTGNTQYPFVYEVQTAQSLHVTNTVQKVKRKRDLATLISITHNN